MSKIIVGGRYKIVSELGSGGFGKTYLAKDTQLPGNPRCVVKQLKPVNNQPLLLKTARRLFATEAEVLYKLGNHNQIPQLLAHFEDQKEFYLVQELIEGHSLSEEFTPGRQFSEAEAIALLQEVLTILEFVHQQGVIHRDIKPSNLIRRHADQKIVLIDFGAVKQLSTQTGLSSGHTTMTISIGSPGYVANEQLAGTPRFSSDIYAVGMMGIQALTGVFPKQIPQDPKTSEIMWRDPVQVSPGLAYVLDKMVRYDFRQRYESATSVLADLRNLESYSAAMITSIAPKTNLSKNLPSERKTQTQVYTRTKVPGKSSNFQSQIITKTESKNRQSKNNLLWFVAVPAIALAVVQLHNSGQIPYGVEKATSANPVDAIATPSSTGDKTLPPPTPETTTANAIATSPSPTPEATPSHQQPQAEVITPTPSPSPMLNSPPPPPNLQKELQTSQTQTTDLQRLLQAQQSKESEAKGIVDLIQKTQLLFYIENNRFSGNLQALGLNMSAQTDAYNYKILVADQTKTIVTATAKKPGLKSYTGVTLMKGTTPQNKICETNSPSNLPPQISVGGNQIQCPAGSSASSGVF